ncbi:MAG: hypothetical protein V7K26_02815 [Nostoc sp.]|uniref:hypothetical protein n=1 Tax=Nostoc sp. TaxID=1180 RepID=UPI002FF37E3C
MTNNRLEILYSQVFEQVYPQIRNQGRGVLYTVMHIIFYAEQSRSSSICNYLDIKSSATLEDDRKIVEGLISNPNDSFNIKNINPFKDERKMELFWIVVLACTLTGVYSCYKYLEYTKEQKATQKIAGSTKSSQPAVSPQEPVTQPRQSLTAALCLVVSANAIGNLRKNSQINVSDIEKLIDAASYFLCIEEADSNQLHPKTTDEDIPTDSNLEVYVKIYIDEGQEMIGKKVLYILKRNLPSHGQGVVKQLACLKNLSGLEKFNRV